MRGARVGRERVRCSAQYRVALHSSAKSPTAGAAEQTAGWGDSPGAVLFFARADGLAELRVAVLGRCAGWRAELFW